MTVWQALAKRLPINTSQSRADYNNGMTAQRFFTPQPLTLGAVSLPAATAHHMRVLRLRVGDAVQLFNGNDQGESAWNGRITQLDKTASVQLTEPASQHCELPFAITVAQSLIEPSKMDWVVEKAVELGVTQIQAIAASRSVTRLDAERAAKRVAHWQAIAIAASEQCGRNRMMVVLSPASLSAALKTTQGAQLLLHPVGGVALQTWCAANPPGPVTLWIGPEGGWSQEELKQLETAGAQRVTFGARVLRTESAAAAIAAALQALWCKN
jgi:16S rRNA (uracil1498-N3)-methyltransferase